MAVIFIYLILASQFGSFLQLLAIMASLPATLIGVFLALLVTGSTLNIFSIIGVIMLMAIGLGDCGEQNAPMGRAVIGGIVTSTLLTLVVVPVLYTYLDSLVTSRAARNRPK
jgi:multidrug efflux pump subunit AcrB